MKDVAKVGRLIAVMGTFGHFLIIRLLFIARRRTHRRGAQLAFRFVQEVSSSPVAQVNPNERGYLRVKVRI